MPTKEQIIMIINNRPSELTADVASDYLKKTVRQLRKLVFINCWNLSSYESHALWKIYCPSNEGVAIQTTIDKLKKSVPYPINKVTYKLKQQSDLTDISKLITQKRPMFAYEKEIRIVIMNNFDYVDSENKEIIGVRVDWDPEIYIDNIWIHPEASGWFMRTVSDIVKRLAPNISTNGNPRVWWSKLNTSPPL
jgi:hypothetical protein